jgi:hypothetical protein
MAVEGTATMPANKPALADRVRKIRGPAIAAAKAAIAQAARRLKI